MDIIIVPALFCVMWFSLLWTHDNVKRAFCKMGNINIVKLSYFI